MNFPVFDDGARPLKEHFELRRLLRDLVRGRKISTEGERAIRESIGRLDARFPSFSGEDMETLAATLGRLLSGPGYRMAIAALQFRKRFAHSAHSAACFFAAAEIDAFEGKPDGRAVALVHAFLMTLAEMPPDRGAVSPGARPEEKGSKP